MYDMTRLSREFGKARGVGVGLVNREESWSIWHLGLQARGVIIASCKLQAGLLRGPINPSKTSSKTSIDINLRPLWVPSVRESNGDFSQAFLPKFAPSARETTTEL